MKHTVEYLVVPVHVRLTYDVEPAFNRRASLRYLKARLAHALDSMTAGENGCYSLRTVGTGQPRRGVLK